MFFLLLLYESENSTEDGYIMLLCNMIAMQAMRISSKKDRKAINQSLN